MKNNEFTFKEDDVKNIDGIVEALHELVKQLKCS